MIVAYVQNVYYPRGAFIGHRIYGICVTIATASTSHRLRVCCRRHCLVQRNGIHLPARVGRLWHLPAGHRKRISGRVCVRYVVLQRTPPRFIARAAQLAFSCIDAHLYCAHYIACALTHMCGVWIVSNITHYVWSMLSGNNGYAQRIHVCGLVWHCGAVANCNC